MLLLVERDRDNARLFCAAAQKAGIPYSIKVARDSLEALDLLLRQRIAPVLTLLDIPKGEADGLTLLRSLRRDPLFRNILIVILTDSDMQSDRIATLKLGCNLFVTRPRSKTGYLEMARHLRELLPEEADWVVPHHVWAAPARPTTANRRRRRSASRRARRRTCS